MCRVNKDGFSSDSEAGPSEEHQDSDSDVSMSDSDVDSSDSEAQPEDSTMDVTDDVADSEDETQANDDEEEEEEDELLKDIRKENTKLRNHPPPINCDDLITDICFHPNADILAVANSVGDVVMYKYSNEQNSIVNTLELHTKACRDVEFSDDGKTLFSVSKDKSIMLSDTETGKLIQFYENAHDEPLYCIRNITDTLFSTGDENGVIKLWDLRVRNHTKPIFSLKRNEDYINDMITDDNHNYLVCASGDGSLVSIDLNKRQFLVQSEEYDEDLTCLGLLRDGSKLIVGTSKGNLLLFNWGEFGMHSDSFPGPKKSINSLIPITENIVVTGLEDGNLRAVHMFPHRYLGVVGQHNHSVEKLDICNNGQFIASTSLDMDIKFWNIEYFEELEAVSQKQKRNKRKEMRHNLPSSKQRNASDFFEGLR